MFFRQHLRKSRSFAEKLLINSSSILLNNLALDSNRPLKSVAGRVIEYERHGDHTRNKLFRLF